MIASSFVALIFTAAVATQTVNPDCVVTDETRTRALALDWDAFDQKGEDRASMRWLATHSCFLEGARLAEYYVQNRPGLSKGNIRNSHFHIGQLFGLGGDNNSALKHFRQAISPDQPANATFDWNTYVTGVIAFFERDHATLKSSQKKLFSSAGPGDKMNSGALARLDKCFDQPYQAAMNKPECAATP